jgi:hypothetical protein
MSTIQNYEVTEGNLRAVKDICDFGGPNKWHFYVMSQRGQWESIQWMDVYRIQKFFNAKLPVYKKISLTKYQLES